MKRAISAAIAGCAGFAILCLVGCSTTNHVTENTTTKYNDIGTHPVPPPSNWNTTNTTTQYDNGTAMQRTVTHPSYPVSPSQSTTVTTDTDNGNVQKRTTTTY